LMISKIKKIKKTRKQGLVERESVTRKDAKMKMKRTKIKLIAPDISGAIGISIDGVPISPDIKHNILWRM